jgi:hypothetical protein
MSDGAVTGELRQGGQKAICYVDPMARLLVERLHVGELRMALAALAWGLLYLFALPAVTGGLYSSEEYVGSLNDWHAQTLLLLVFPFVCAFYVWQPKALARAYDSMHLRWALREVGKGYRSRVWLVLSISLAMGIILFDFPKMLADRGSFWMAENWLTIAGREASLATAFYILSMITWRQVVASLEWRRLLPSPVAGTALNIASGYVLTWALLLGLLGLRLSIEAIELPHRVGAVTPDYYAKVAVYVVGGVVSSFAPVWRAFRKDSSNSVDGLVLGLELLGILSLPLLGFLVLKVVFGP